MEAGPLHGGEKAPRRWSSLGVVSWLILIAAVTTGVPPEGQGARERTAGTGETVTSRVIELAAPVLLVAGDALVDPNFQKSVVLLLAHDEEGSVGLVLTHVSHVLNGDVGKKLNVRVPARAAGIAVREGGPVDPGRGFVLHDRDDLANERAIVKGLYIDAPERVLETLLKDGEARARLFVGYSGWGPGQLDAEVARGDWTLAAATPREVFDLAPEGLWATLRRETDSKTGSARARPRKESPKVKGH